MAGAVSGLEQECLAEPTYFLFVCCNPCIFVRRKSLIFLV